jgi:putative nucleotidyltransferase with HDIG domain
VAKLRVPKLGERGLWALEASLLAATAAAAVVFSHSGEWHPASLLIVLLVLALGGEWFTVEASPGVISASLAVMVLGMGLLGPAPAALCGMAAIGIHSAVSRRSLDDWLNNLVCFGVAAFAAGWVVRGLSGDVSGAHHQHLAEGIVFGLVLLGAMAILLLLNFLLWAVHLGVKERRSLLRDLREQFWPMLPGEMAVGVIAVLLVLAYRSAGLAAVVAAIPILLIFRQLTVALLRSEQRAEQLDARTRQLSSFQWAVPSTFMEGLGLRDPTAMRHGAAVASYARAIAVELGCSEEEQEAIHLAGLLHDIGKFTWSDRILHPEQLTDEDWAIIRRHPQDGAMMLGKFEGFGTVADAILYHHERIDGRGYPAGLIGEEIPLASRIVSICSTYDTMINRDAYGERMSPQEAMAELRKIAGSQLDAELVETFIALLERKGAAFGQDADYRTELSFERRVRMMAAPSPGQSAALPRRPAAVRLRNRD